MHALDGVVLAAAALLMVAAAPKIARPRPTAAALRSVGLTFVTPGQARVVAACELVVGLAALAVGSTLTALAVAAAYLGFSLFLLRALTQTEPGASCGCTGRADTPPTWAHLALTATFAALVVAAAASGGHSGLSELRASAGSVVPGVMLGLVAVTTWLGWVVITELSRLNAAQHPRSTHHPRATQRPRSNR